MERIKRKLSTDFNYKISDDQKRFFFQKKVFVMTKKDFFED